MNDEIKELCKEDERSPSGYCTLIHEYNGKWYRDVITSGLLSAGGSQFVVIPKRMTANEMYNYAINNLKR